MSNAIQKVTDACFQTDVLKSPLPVLVDFWAEWCGPCKMLTPVLEDIANEHAARVKVAKVNIDENPKLASRYKFQSMLTLLYCKGGEVRAQTVGFTSKSAILGKIGSLEQ